MIFGAINYLNLLSFNIFIKKYISSSQIKMILKKGEGVPSLINNKLKKRKIDAGFISSIKSKKYKCGKLGIIANKNVYSVFVIKGKNEEDIESATSNKIASILGIEGKVIIGNKALKYYLNGGEAIDLATSWYNKYKLPCIFARLCYINHKNYFSKLEKKFIKNKIKIPYFISMKEAKKMDISRYELLWYLDKIRYKIDYKVEKSLRILLKN